MTPSIDIRLASMIRSMTDVITPSIDPSNSLAREQASLMVGHLHLFALQWRKVFPFAEVCLADLDRCARGLRPSGGSATVAAADALAAALELTGVDPEHHYQSATSALEELVRAVEVDGDDETRLRVELDVLGFSQRQAERDRAWFAMSGFDVDADKLPSIDDIIAKAA